MNVLFPTWLNFNNASINSDIHIFRLFVNERTQKLPVYKNFLNPVELLRSSRFYKAADRERYIISRGALKQLLGQYIHSTPEQIEIILDENKKPIVKDYSHIHFNISHSKNCIVLAFSDKNIGIDVEYIDAGFNYNPIAEACFTDAEMKFMQKSANPLEVFFMLWTRKEAFLKADGKGLHDDMNKVNCLNQCYSSGQIVSFETDESYVAGVAYKCSQNKLLFYNLIK